MAVLRIPSVAVATVRAGDGVRARTAEPGRRSAATGERSPRAVRKVLDA